jgi:hypothetical protein
MLNTSNLGETIEVDHGRIYVGYSVPRLITRMGRIQDTSG